MTDRPERPSPIYGLSAVRLPPASPVHYDDALVVPGGWCAPIGPTYDMFLRPATPDLIAWNRPDWDRLVAPRLTALLAARAEVRRRLRLARYALADLRAALAGRDPADADDACCS